MTLVPNSFLSPDFVYFIVIASTIIFNAISVGIGQGIAGCAALNALNEQPAAKQAIIRTSLFGLALIETAAVMGSVIAFVLLLSRSDTSFPLFSGIASISIACAICIPGFVIGIISALPVKAACKAIARQPFFEQTLGRFMLVMLSLLQTPIIFGLIIALLLKSQIPYVYTVYDMLRLISGGLCIGLGTIGPSCGLAFFMTTALESLGRFKESYNPLRSFIFISQAIIETSAIFTVIGSLLLVLVIPSAGTKENIIDGIKFLCGACILGLGTLGCGLGSGGIAASACQQISYYPDRAPLIARTGMFSQGIVETGVIYSFLFFLMLIFFV